MSDLYSNGSTCRQTDANGYRRFVTPDEIEQTEADEREPIHQEIVQPPTAYRRLQLAMGDYRKQRNALETVVDLLIRENNVQPEALHRTVCEAIDHRLLLNVAMIARNELSRQKRIIPA